MMTVVALVLCLNSTAQKLDAMSRITIQQMKQKEVLSAKANGTSTLRAINSKTVNALVKLQEGNDITELTKHGFQAQQLCTNFATVTTTLDSLSILSDIKSVERISIAQRKMELMLNKANALTGVDKIHNGLEPDQDDRINEPDFSQHTYTGKGVMIGIFDSGFDPNHAMFLDENGMSRFKFIKTENGEILDSPKDIAKFTTDDRVFNHASHVSGIAAGYYKGDDYSIEGVAPEAELAMGPITFEASELEYLQFLGTYCNNNNKRLIINMSYGQNVGPHDGSDLYTQALNEIIKEYDIVACISAGNQANEKIVQKRKLTSSDDEMKGIYDIATSGHKVDQYITTNQQTAINMSIAVVEHATGKLIKNYPIIEHGNLSQISINDDYLIGDFFIGEESIHNNSKGYALKCDNASLCKSGTKLGFIITGSKEQEINCYTSVACPYTSKTIGWNENLTSNGSIINEACGKETIVVGAYVSNASITYKSGKTDKISKYYKNGYGCNIGDIWAASSFSTQYDGEFLPHICAPGAYIESASNRYYSYTSSVTRNISFNGLNYPLCGMMGTSMSSPYMAGVAALWLEANPNLSHQEIKEIAMKTAINDEACNEGNHFINEGRQAGAGKLNAYAGLKYILEENEATLINTPQEKSFLIRKISQDTFEAYQAGATSMTATLYNIEGKMVTTQKEQGNTIHINTTDCSKGIYLLKIASNKGIYTQKVAIR